MRKKNAIASILKLFLTQFYTMSTICAPIDNMYLEIHVNWFAIWRLSVYLDCIGTVTMEILSQCGDDFPMHNDMKILPHWKISSKQPYGKNETPERPKTVNQNGFFKV